MIEACRSNIEVLIPMRLKSLANETSEHWTTRMRRKKEQDASVYFALKPIIGRIRPPCMISLTRIAPRSLDEDNNIIAFKNIRDQIAQLFFPGTRKGQADGYGCFTWKYYQTKGKPKEYAIKIKIEEASCSMTPITMGNELP